MSRGGWVRPTVSNKQDQTPRNTLHIPLIQMGRKSKNGGREEKSEREEDG
jgi:hypothetical protein